MVCNTENRLGRLGAQEIKNHAFFRSVDFDGLRRIRAPFEPRLTSNIDTAYFPTDEIDQIDLPGLRRPGVAGRGRERPRSGPLGRRRACPSCPVLITIIECLDLPPAPSSP